MSKGTPSKGKQSGKKSHRACRRCGKISYHITKRYCASCGFGKSKKMRTFAWNKK